MNEKLPTLSVQMFGRPRITYGEHPVLSGEKPMTKVQQLLLLLLYSAPEGIERSRLAEALYGREDILDTTNNLNVTVYRLKKFLVGGVFLSGNMSSSKTEFTAGLPLCLWRWMPIYSGN